MGWTSKREQEIEKMVEGLSNLKKSSNSIEQSIEKGEIEKAKEQISTFKKEVDHIYIQSKDFVEILTDPTIEIPIELKIKNEECVKLKEEMENLKLRCTDLENVIENEKGKFQKKKKECKKLERKLRIHDHLCRTNDEYKKIYMNAYLDQVLDAEKEDLEE